MDSFMGTIDGLAHFYKYELPLWSRVAHENVIKIFELYDDWTDGSGFASHGHPYMYLLMQYADYGTLGSIEEETGTFKRNNKIYDRVRQFILERDILSGGKITPKHTEHEEIAKHIFN